MGGAAHRDRMIRWDRASLWVNRKVAPRVYFRWATPGDADQEYLGWLHQPEVRRWLSFPSHRVTDLKKYIRRQVNNRNVSLFIIYVAPSAPRDVAPRLDQRIGTLKVVREKDGTASLGLMLGAHRGHGLGTEAIQLACQYVRDAWGIREVWCGIHANNAASIRAFEKAGFTIRPHTVKGLYVSPA